MMMLVETTTMLAGKHDRSGATDDVESSHLLARFLADDLDTLPTIVPAFDSILGSLYDRIGRGCH